MIVEGQPCRSLWPTADGMAVEIIDQTRLPHLFLTARLHTLRDAERAIRNMLVRGAPLIGVTAAYGMALSMRDHASDAAIAASASLLLKSRPTAVNLCWAVARMQACLLPLPEAQRAEAAWQEAGRMAEEDVAMNQRIGQHGLPVIQAIYQRTGKPVNILTHCNAGWLATVDWGTALAPIYAAHQAGIPLHIWVDETRPRNQGASLTAWELGQQGIPHTLIVDNAGGHLMQHGMVDLCIVGCDRATARGDVCNKIGTYLKALAAFDNRIPFYVALPTSTIDWTLQDGIAEIPIEERATHEVTHIIGQNEVGECCAVRITPVGCLAANYGFDVTPARLVTALITEHGVVAAETAAMQSLRPTPA